jgi:hypothetical protein
MFKSKLRSGFDFQYPQKPYGFWALSYMGSGLDFLGFELRAHVLYPD